MEDFVRRLCVCGYSENTARSLCAEFWRELGRDSLEEYIEDIEHNMARVLPHVEAV